MVRIKKRGARAAGGPKQKQQKRLFKKVQVNEPEIAKHWDPRRSRGANLARMGLSDDANRAVGVPGAAPSVRIHAPRITSASPLRRSQTMVSACLPRLPMRRSTYSASAITASILK